MSDAIGRRHGMPARHLQPLRVLVEHRVDDVDERLVAVEEAVPCRSAGSPRASPGTGAPRAPRSTRPSGARCSSVGRISRLPLAVGRREDVAEPVRRGLVRAEDAELLAGSRAMTSRRNAPSTRVASLDARRRARRPRRRSRGSRAGRGRAAAAPPFACGFALMRRSPSRRERAQLGPSAPRRRTAPRAGSCAATPRAARGAPSFVARRRRAAPGASATCPRPAARRPRRARPALRRPQDDHRPARRAGPPAARPGSRRSRRAPRRVPRRSASCTGAGSSPATRSGR